MLKKVSFSICIFCLIFLMASVNYLPVFASNEDEFIWIEAENYSSANGYTKLNWANASGGAVMKCDTTTVGSYTVNYQFNVPTTDAYAVWILSSVGSQSYVSKYRWRMDGGADGNNPFPLAAEIYKSADTRTQTMGWYRITTKELTSGTHSIEFVTDERRTSLNDFYYHVLDTVVIVPVNWQWIPGVSKNKPVKLVSDMLWMEAENFTDNVGGENAGGYKFTGQSSTGKVASGMYLMRQFETTFDSSKIYDLSYVFRPQRSGNYDIYVISTPGNQTYATKYKYKLDSSDYVYANSTATLYKEAYRNNDNVGMCWQKLTTASLSNDIVHKITFRSDEKRSMDNYRLHSLDAIAIVPSGTAWTIPTAGAGVNVTTDILSLEKAAFTLPEVNLNLVTGDLQLPLKTPNGATIGWQSSNAAIIDSSGKVTRPTFDGNDTVVTLTANLSKTQTTANETQTAAETKLFDANVIKMNEKYSITNFKLTYSSGSEIGSGLSAGQNVKATVSIKNNESVENPAVLVVALYGPNGLVKMVDLDPKILNSAEQAFEVEFTLPVNVEDVSGCYLKAFIWNSLDQMIPLESIITKGAVGGGQS